MLRRAAKVFVISTGVFIALGAALVAYVCWRFAIGPFYAFARWTCLDRFEPQWLFPLMLAGLMVWAVLAVRLLPRRMQVAAVVAVGLLILGTSLARHFHYPQYDQFTPSRAQLDETRRWFWGHPPDGTNRTERRERMAVIQRACDQLRPEVFDEYQNGWYGHEWLESHGLEWLAKDLNHTSDQLEAEHPALYYLGQTTAAAIEDIRRTRVRKGLVIWYIYNMGYVFRSPEACFGIDLLGPGLEQLAGELDLLLITHRHPDHCFEPLEERMIRQGKPVIAGQWFQKGWGDIVPEGSGQWRFGKLRVRAQRGDHGFARSRQEAERYRDFVLMFQVDCEEGEDTCTVYHTGDAGNVAKMRPDRPVDVLFVHVGAPVPEIVRHLNPRMTFASHVLELGHPPKLPIPGRMPFDFAYRWSLRGLPESRSAVLTWGQRWMLPGTVLAASDDPIKSANEAANKTHVLPEREGKALPDHDAERNNHQ